MISAIGFVLGILFAVPFLWAWVRLADWVEARRARRKGRAA